MRWFALFLSIVVLAACNDGPSTPPSDAREGLGGKSGTDAEDRWHPSPAERTGTRGESVVVQLSADEQAALRRAEYSAAVMTAAPLMLGGGTAGADTAIGQIAEHRRQLMRRLNESTGMLEVENAARAGAEYQALRQRVEALPPGSRAAAIVSELVALHERDVADLGLLARSQNQAVRAYAGEAQRIIGEDLSRLRSLPAAGAAGPSSATAPAQ